jgi:TPR repeat protein
MGMEQGSIKLVGGTDTVTKSQQACNAVVAQCLAAAEQGCSDALFDLGVVFSTGDHGIAVDLVEAHKWFNLAAVGGHADAAGCRADIAEDMTAREISEAQRRAREWLRASADRAKRQVA